MRWRTSSGDRSGLEARPGRDITTTEIQQLAPVAGNAVGVAGVVGGGGASELA